MNQLRDHIDEPATAPAWPGAPYARYEPIQVKPTRAFLCAQAGQALAAPDFVGIATPTFVGTAMSTSTGTWQQHPGAVALTSFANTGGPYDMFFPGAVIGVCNNTATTTGSLTLSTIVGSTANTYDCDVISEIPTSDPFVGYERYAVANWDGYDADPITPETLKAARTFIRILPATFGDPDIAPGADGTIGLEWIFNNKPLRKLFIDIGPGAVWSGFWRRVNGEKETLPTAEIDLSTRSYLARLFKKLNS